MPAVPVASSIIADDAGRRDRGILRHHHRCRRRGRAPRRSRASTWTRRWSLRWLCRGRGDRRRRRGEENSAIAVNVVARLRDGEAPCIGIVVRSNRDRVAGAGRSGARGTITTALAARRFQRPNSCSGRIRISIAWRVECAVLNRFAPSIDECAESFGPPAERLAA